MKRTYASAKVFMRLERLVEALVGDIPNSNSLIIRGGDKVLASWMPTHVTYPAVVADKCVKTGTSTDVPQF